MSYSLNRLSQIFHTELRHIIDQALSDLEVGNITAEQIHDHLRHPATLREDVDADPINDVLDSDRRMQRHSWAEVDRALAAWVGWIRVTRRQATRPAPSGIADPVDQTTWGKVMETVTSGLDQLLDVDLSPAAMNRDDVHLELEGSVEEWEQMVQVARRQLRNRHS